MSMVEEMAFEMRDMLTLKDKYTRMIWILVNNAFLCSEIANLVSATDVDNFAANVTRIFTIFDRTLFLIRESIEYEFRIGSRDPSSILRGNCPASKLETQYCKLVGTGYLQLLFSDLIKSIILADDLVLEIDPSKMKNYGLNEEDVVTNAKHLEEICEVFIYQITRDENLERMPRDIRVIAGHTAEFAKKYCPDQMTALVGGFINLRFFVPAIVAPDGFGILEEDIIPTPTARRNLILVAKILQKISNGVSAVKEPYMSIMDDFCNSKMEIIEDYLIRISTDPLLEKGYVPWNDFIYKTVPLSEINLEILNVHDVFNLHRILYPLRNVITRTFEDSDSFTIRSKQKQYENESFDGDNRQAVRIKHGSSSLDMAIENLMNLQDDIIINVRETILEFPDLLMSLGAPPSKRLHKHSNSLTKKRTESVMHISNDSLDACEFLYPGETDKAGNVLIYIIFQRLEQKYLTAEILELTRYINEKIIQYSDGKNYAIVIDTSWISGSYDHNTTIITNVKHILSTADHDQRKRAKALYFVHPTSFIFSSVRIFKTFASPKLSRKIHFFWEWKDILNYIIANNLNLPAETKGYIAQAYIITKMNNAKKRQTRILKLTGNSILNIEPSSKKIQNEKLITEISQITLCEGHIISLQFAEDTSGSKKFWQNKKDVESRIYVCDDDRQRDEIIQDIFEVVLRLDTLQYPLEYSIRKVKKSKFGETLTRVYKFTLDSLLSVDGGVIKKEMPYTQLISVQREKYDERVVKLTFIDGKTLSMIILSHSPQQFISLVENCIEHTKLIQTGQKEDLLGYISRFYRNE